MLHGEHSATHLTFIKLPSVIKIIVLSMFEWPLKTGFSVLLYLDKIQKTFYSRLRSVSIMGKIRNLRKCFIVAELRNCKFSQK